MSIEKKRCTRCNVMLPLKNFDIKRDDEYYKRCKQCTAYDRVAREINKCEHHREKTRCRECCGGAFCEHQRIKYKCKHCKGVSICEHQRQRYECVDCDGNGICEHRRQRSSCKECSGTSICEHQTYRYYCRICNLSNYVKRNIMRRMYMVLGYADFEYLGCTIEEFMAHIEGEFTEGMSWENYGEWHIDHIKPLGAKDLTEEEIIERFEFTNTQPLWAYDNKAKHNKEI